METAHQTKPFEERLLRLEQQQAVLIARAEANERSVERLDLRMQDITTNLQGAANQPGVYELVRQTNSTVQALSTEFAGLSIQVRGLNDHKAKVMAWITAALFFGGFVGTFVSWALPFFRK